MHKIRFYDTIVIYIQAKSSYLACHLVVDSSKPIPPTYTGKGVSLCHVRIC